MTESIEDRIRARAHAIWDSEGRPEGRHDEHWRRAFEEVGAGFHPADDAAGAKAAGSGDSGLGIMPEGGTLGTPGGVASGLQPGGTIPGGGPGTGVGSLGTGGGSTAGDATGTPARGTT
jgi:hypothetical protein